jgi:hypothetical protein
LRALVLARIIEPSSKVDALRLLAETGVEPPACRTLKRRLPVFAKPAVRQALSKACVAQAQLGPASLVLYDVSTLHFEADAGDGFRELGFQVISAPDLDSLCSDGISALANKRDAKEWAMDKNPRHPTRPIRDVVLADVMTPNIVTAEDSLSDFSKLNAEWLVLTGSDQGIVGVVSRNIAVAAASVEEISYLARRENFEVLPADLELGSPRSAVGARPSVTGLVVAVENRTPVGVWAGDNELLLVDAPEQGGVVSPAMLVVQSFAGWRRKSLSKSAGAIDTQLGGDIGLTIFTGECKYREPGQLDECGFSWSFVDGFGTVMCGNPRGWTPHEFIW